MIHSFSGKNFYSIKDSATVDFTVNDNAPHNDGYFKGEPSDTRLSKVEAIIGPNASGKTKLLQILPFFKWLIVDSLSLPPQFPLPVKAFMSPDCKDKPIELSVVFDIGANLYTYKFALDQSKIISEELALSAMAKEKKSSKTLFSRSWNSETKKYNFDGEKFDLPKNFENLLGPKASVISLAIRLSHKPSQEIADFWQKLETNVGESGRGEDAIPNISTLHLIQAINFFAEKENSQLKTEAEKLLSSFDPGLEGLEIKKEDKPGGASISFSMAHSFGGQKQLLPINYESSGTQRFLVLLKYILPVLKNGGIAVLDEIDASLHPDMVMFILNLFIQPENNPSHAQLLFSTHSHRVLNYLDKYQIILTEKNSNGSTEAWRLDEMNGVRADDNYYAKYMAGAYGAVPKI